MLSKFVLFLSLRVIGVLFLISMLCLPLNAKDLQVVSQSFVVFHNAEGNFSLATKQGAAPLLISKSDYKGVLTIADYFQKDIQKVTSHTPHLYVDEIPQADDVIIIGSVDKCTLIQQLIAEGKINVDAIQGQWESTLIQVIENPFPNVKRALVIAGSDKRGTIYGMFDLSRKMGVSPWYFWSDVSVIHRDVVSVRPVRYVLEEPKVKYRGIFLNDEEPALGRWAVENYGGFNSAFYVNVFELILRLKGNYMWPAMWWASFPSDDPRNLQLADEMGVVIGNSHHEPMMRAHAEWKSYNGGEWNYKTNKKQLDAFWRGGIERMGNYESLVTLAMRGDGDEAMEEETNIQLLENIVANQRKIIADVTQKPITETPQLWALYKEVQEYYDRGMDVPEDVILLFCDDNWGNVRVLPDVDAPIRTGGYGMYYHFDYVGAPRCYSWLNTNSLPCVWEQMRLTYEHGVDKVWIVNVGDLKPMELPISFFLDYAWNPEAIGVEELGNYTTMWAAEQFGDKYKLEIAEMLDVYSHYMRRCTPELLNDSTYSLYHYREFETVVSNYNRLEKEAKQLYEKLDKIQKDAFYQLVYFPIAISANLNEMYYCLAKNKSYAEEQRVATNDMADSVIHLFKRDSLLTVEYHTQLAGGKWNHMMAQPHIGYQAWNAPNENIQPTVIYIDLPRAGKLGLRVEGEAGIFPMFDNVNQQEFYFEVFNKGLEPVEYTIEAPNWVNVNRGHYTLTDQKRYFISINWDHLSSGVKSGSITIQTQDGKQLELNLLVKKYKLAELVLKGAVECNGVVAIEAADYDVAVAKDGIDWEIIDGLGNTKGSVTTVPVNRGFETIAPDNAHLEYTFTLLEKAQNDEITLRAYFAPTQDFINSGGLRYAISVDDEIPYVINLHGDCVGKDWTYAEWWCAAVATNKMIKKSHHILNDGQSHIIKYWAIDPGIVLQRIIVDNGGLQESYLGPLF